MVVPERPEVTLVGGTSPLAPADVLASGDDEPPRRPWLLLVAVLVAVALALLGAVRPDQPSSDGDLAAELVLDVDGITVSQLGVLVVPVDLRNLGAALEVRRAQVFAEPVRLDAEVQAPPALAEGETRRLVVLLAPDCRLLRAQSGLSFQASVLVRVGAGSAGRDLVLDLASDPVVAEWVAGLCGQVGTPS